MKKWFFVITLGWGVLTTQWGISGQTTEYVVVTPSVSDQKSNYHQNGYWDADKAIGIQNARVGRAQKAGRISRAQAKELHKKVTSAFLLMQHFATENHVCTLTQEQFDKVMALCNNARQAIDGVLGPEPVGPAVAK